MATGTFKITHVEAPITFTENTALLMLLDPDPEHPGQEDRVRVDTHYDGTKGQLVEIAASLIIMLMDMGLFPRTIERVLEGREDGAVETSMQDFVVNGVPEIKNGEVMR